MLVIASVAILFLSWALPRLFGSIHRLVFRRKYQAIALEDDDDEEVAPVSVSVMPSHGLASDFRKHVRSLREYGTVLFALEVLRTLCLAALLALSIVAAIQAEAPDSDTQAGANDIDTSGHWGKKKKKKKSKHRHKNKTHSPLDDYSSLEWSEFGVVGFYVSL